jgi:hypothetical protein
MRLTAGHLCLADGARDQTVVSCSTTMHQNPEEAPPLPLSRPSADASLPAGMPPAESESMERKTCAHHASGSSGSTTKAAPSPGPRTCVSDAIRSGICSSVRRNRCQGKS